MESLEVRLRKAYSIMDNTQLWTLFNQRFHPSSQKYYFDRNFMIDCLMSDNPNPLVSEYDCSNGNDSQ